MARPARVAGHRRRGPDGHRIDVVTLHTTGERGAMRVSGADLAYDLGHAADRPCLDYAALEKALLPA